MFDALLGEANSKGRPVPCPYRQQGYQGECA